MLYKWKSNITRVVPANILWHKKSPRASAIPFDKGGFLPSLEKRGRGDLIIRMNYFRNRLQRAA